MDNRSRTSPLRSTSWGMHAALLTLLCLLTYFPGLDSHGVTNWQEGQRLVVARDMQSRAEWLLPTVNGRPYIAKPPMIYWAQLALASALGDTVELWHLRFVVALAGLLGVLATYAAARELLTPDRPTDADRKTAARAAVWSAALMAVGILYVRAARIGELDILLVPFVTCAISALARAFRTHREHRRANLPAVACATLATTAAVLTKDPGLLYVALAGYGGIALWYAHTTAPIDTHLTLGRGRNPLALPSPAPGRLLAIAATVGALAFAALSARNVTSAADVPGLALIAAAGAWLGALLTRLAQPLRARAFLIALSRTHPVIVLGVPAALRIGWWWLIAARIGPEAAGRAAQAEADDNLRLFVPEAVLNNIEPLSFGLGLGSVLAIVAIVLLLRTRPRITAGAAVIFAWIAFTLIAFSILGKGVQRYLTPMWPAWAILAGTLAASWCRPRPLRLNPAPWLAALIIVLAAAQSLQYGWLRDRLNARRSPRDLIAALVTRPEWRGPGQFFSFEFASPALDYYTGSFVQIVGDPRAGATMLSGDAWSLAQLEARIAQTGEPAIVLMRKGPIPGIGLAPAIDRVQDAGLRAEPLDNLPDFRIDNGRTSMYVVRVTRP